MRPACRRKLLRHCLAAVVPLPNIEIGDLSKVRIPILYRADLILKPALSVLELHVQLQHRRFLRHRIQVEHLVEMDPVLGKLSVQSYFCCEVLPLRLWKFILSWDCG